MPTSKPPVEFSLEAFDLDAKTVRLRFMNEPELHAYLRKFFPAEKGALAPAEALPIPPEPLGRVVVEAECSFVHRWMHYPDSSAATIRGDYKEGSLELSIKNDPRVVRGRRYRVTVEEIGAGE